MMQSLLVFAIFLFGASAVNSQRTNCSDTGTFYTEDRLFTFTYTRNGGDVEITATAVTDNWVAIGISENMIMPETDVGVGARNGNSYFLDDRYNTGRTLPPFDDSQDFSARSVVVEDGNVTISFTRPVDSGDNRDISLNECRYVLWAYGGAVTSYGSNGMNGVFGGHPTMNMRGVFSEQVCLCGDAATVAVSVISLVIMLVAALYYPALL